MPIREISAVPAYRPVDGRARSAGTPAALGPIPTAWPWFKLVDYQDHNLPAAKTPEDLDTKDVWPWLDPSSQDLDKRKRRQQLAQAYLDSKRHPYAQQVIRAALGFYDELDKYSVYLIGA